MEAFDKDLKESFDAYVTENSGVLVSRPIEVSVSVPENNAMFHFGNMNLY